MIHIITKIDILFYFEWPAISTYTIVLYGLHAINLLSCFCSIFLSGRNLFIYTVLIERAIHNSMCSNALGNIPNLKLIHNK